MSDSIVFYKSFYDVMRKMPAEDLQETFNAVMDYAFCGTEPTQLGYAADIAFTLIRPQIDANIKRRKNGSRGGRPPTEKTDGYTDKKPVVTELKTNGYANEKPNVNVNDNVNVNNKNTMCKADANALFERLWKAYPNKRGKGQVPDTKKCKLAEIGEEHMLRAMTRYIEDLKQNDWLKPQNGSTFFNSGYVDYLDDNYTQSNRESSSRESNKFKNFSERSNNYADLQAQLLKKGME